MQGKLHTEIADSGKSGAHSWGSAIWFVLFCLVALAFSSNPAHAADAGYSITIETVETYEVEIVEPDNDYAFPVSLSEASWPAGEAKSAPKTAPQFGPFTVVAADTAEMSGTVDSLTPGRFRKMMAAYPGIRRIEMIDCAGSVDEEANLQLARMVRRAGISTHVPAHGSIRSGAVELFLAGVRHTADEGAEFVVHSWMDEDGLEANDYPPSDPVHAEYLNYYTEMGIPADIARKFYAMTNSVPFDSQLALSRADIQAYNLLN